MATQQDEMNKALESRESEYVNEIQRNRPHLKNGLSKHAAGIAAQLLVHWFPAPYDAGFMERGVAFGLYWYQNHPVGAGLAVHLNGKRITFLVYGHEQLVIIFTPEGKIIRQSHIDVVMYNTGNGQLEFWDLKTNAGAEFKTEIDPDYKGQLNLYAFVWARQLGLPYDPVCRLEIADPMNWNTIKFQSFVMDTALGEKSLESIGTYEKFKDRTFDSVTKEEWVNLIDVCFNRTKFGRYYYTKPDGSRGYHDKTTWRISCERCDNWGKCVAKLGEKWSRDDLLVKMDLKPGIKWGFVG